ncbi:PepSY domain-containing protein [Shewanella polaris]|uniref:Uncharacterized protein n=1 Tax=Shewanella polaris TaxID=2588449 RepID=A0A4Y5YIH5_9GAMM|nr:hypothetical protein [Shewanella polaris]QDE32524.1 hypothetical protein FH971_17095 [Shewanella polaris]
MNSLFSIAISSLMAITINQQEIPVKEFPLDHDNVQKLVSSGNIPSLDDYLAWVSQYCDGHLIDAQLYQDKDKDKWRYDLQFKLTHGHVINLQLDAANGIQDSLNQLPSECTKHETVTR